MSFIKFWTGAAWKIVDTTNVFKVRVVGAPDAWKDVKFLRVYELYNGQVGWREVWVKGAPPPPPPPPEDPPSPPPPIILDVSVLPTSVFGTAYAPGTVTTKRDATVTVSNGTGPYQYIWQLMTWSSSIPPLVVSQGAAATRFSQQMVDIEETEEATFRCLVVDSLGNQGSAQVDATFITTEHVGAGGGGGFPTP